jgi:hypothetical protein
MVNAERNLAYQRMRHKREETEQLDEIIAISQITMKRLLNYQRVIENNAKAANKRQWMEMTLENMRKAEESRQAAELIGATVAYAGYLFRVQHKMMNYRASDNDGLLYNALIELMNRLNISVEMVAVDELAFKQL